MWIHSAKHLGASRMNGAQAENGIDQVRVRNNNKHVLVVQ